MIQNTTESILITPAMAHKILEEECFSDQRKRSKNHIDFLREVMRRGEFDGGESIRFAEINGKRFLINGQHRLEAIRSGGGEQNIVVIISKCDTTEEVALLYSRIDRGRGRNIADVLRAIGVSLHEDMTQKQIIAVMSCAPLFFGELRGDKPHEGFSYTSKSAEGRSNIMKPWLGAAKNYFDAIGKPAFGNERQFYRRDALAVGIATFSDSPAAERAPEFWGGMATDDGLQADDPRKQCLEFLKRQSKLGRSSYGIGFTAHGVTVCWNAWMRKATLRFVRVMDEKAPLRIAGTRFARRLEDGSVAVATGRAKAPEPDSNSDNINLVF